MTAFDFIPISRRMLLLVLLFAVAAAAMAEREPLDRVIAVVDEGVVLQSDLQTRTQQIKSRLRAQGTGMPPEQQMRKRVLDQLILEEIQVQRARKLGMRISDSELNNAMRRVASNNGYNSVDQFQQALASEGLSFQQSREQIQRQMLVQRIQQQRVGQRIRITRREVNNFLETSQAQQRSGIEYLLGHIMIKVNNFNNEEEVAAARAKARRVKNQLDQGADFRETALAESDGRKALEGGELGWRTEREMPSLAAGEIPELEVGEASDVLQSGSGFHIVAPLDRRGGGGAGNNQVQQHNVRHILIDTRDRPGEQARSLIRDVNERLEQGESFAKLAREFSDDPGSGEKGGDLGWVGPGEMVPAFDETMQRTDVGERSEPFKSRFGWHILEVSDRRSAEVGDERRRREARRALQRRRFDLELRNWLGQIRGEAFVEVKTDVVDVEWES